MLSTDRENRNHDDCLRVQQLIDQQIAVTVFKSLNGDAADYLKQMFVPLSEIHRHNTCNHSTGLFPVHTNSLSKDVWTSQTMKDFQLKLRKHMKKE